MESRGELRGRVGVDETTNLISLPPKVALVVLPDPAQHTGSRRCGSSFPIEEKQNLMQYSSNNRKENDTFLIRSQTLQNLTKNSCPLFSTGGLSYEVTFAQVVFIERWSLYRGQNQ